MKDRAAEVAAYLVEEQDGSMGPSALWAEMRKRWPDLREEEGIEPPPSRSSCCLRVSRRSSSEWIRSAPSRQGNRKE